MIFQGGRAIGRLPQLSLQCLGGRRVALSSSNVERVAALHNVFQTQHIFDLALKPSLTTPIFRRTYAGQPVSRPKAHTGRTTTAARKVPTTSKTKAAKKPASKTKNPKAKPKAKSKAKPRIKPKPKLAKKAKAKPKRKVLTEAQKNAATIKKLKIAALQPPGGVPSNAWTVFLGEASKGATTGPKGNKSLGSISSQASVEYKNLSPERLEHYNHLANQNKAANAKAYRQWIESHTPNVIYEANLARQNLNRRQKKRYNMLQDQRQVKGVTGAYTRFYIDRQASGDFKGLKAKEAARLAGREWKGLSASEKKPYEDAQKQDQARYVQEVKTVYNRDVRNRPQAASAA